MWREEHKQEMQNLFDKEFTTVMMSTIDASKDAKNPKYGKSKPPKMEVRAENIPEFLKQQERWVNWHWTRKGRKYDKPPCTPTGSNASVLKPSTWSTFSVALSASQKKLDGIGFVMDGTGDLIGLDIDNCRDPETGDISDFAKEIINDLKTYAEISPSGTGVKLWLRGDFDASKWKKQNKDVGLELYKDRRYFTVTGHYLNGITEIASIGKEFDRILVNYFLTDDFAKTQTHTCDLSRSIENAKDAIKVLDPNCGFKEWVDIGMSLHWLDPGLFSDWD